MVQVKQEIHLATQLIDYRDEELKAFLLNTHEALKAIEEEKKNDPELEKLQEALKSYKNLRYTTRTKSFKALLRAGRSIAKARGITFEIPDEVS